MNESATRYAADAPASSRIYSGQTAESDLFFDDGTQGESKRTR